MSREEALAARWLHEPQPISNQPVGLEFAHFTKRYRLEGSAFSSPESWSCRDMDGFLTRGWELILPGCGGTSVLARGAALAARWLHEPQPISNHPVGLEFPHHAGRYRLGESAFTSPGCSSPGATGPQRWPEGQPSPRAGSMSLSQSATSQLVWGFHTLRGGIDPRGLPFRPQVVGVVDIRKCF